MELHWEWAAGLVYAGSVAISIAALFVVPRNRRPGSATAWLMLIALLPYLGLAVFWLIGSPKLSRRRRALQRAIDQQIAVAVEDAHRDPALARIFDRPVPARYAHVANLATRLGGLPPCAGNRVEILDDYDGTIRSITDAVAAARRSVHVEFYILAMDAATEPFFVALECAVRRGVRVRILIDHIGALRYPGRTAMTRRLTAAGVEWHWMLPVRPFRNHWNRPDLRNHRKIVVIDGTVGYVGSMNMIDRSYLLPANVRRGLRYVDLMARVTGPVVAELDAAFQADWLSETGERLGPPDLHALSEADGGSLCQVLPSGSAYTEDNNLRVFVEAIHTARERLVITSPYFVPDDALMTAITSAAYRGVAVTLYSSAYKDKLLVHHAQRSFYEQLLRAGVEIRLVRTPALLHAKHLTVDDGVAIVGSSNLDMRSLTLNLEVTLLAYDADVVADLRAVEAEYHARSDPVDVAAWLARPLRSQLLDNVARLTSALQ